MSCWTFVQIDLKVSCSTARPVLEGQPSRRWQPSSWWSIFFVTLGRSSSHGDEWMGAIDVVGCAKFVSMGIDLESYGVIWGHMIYIMQLYVYTIHVWHTDIYIYNYTYTCVSSSRTGSADISPWKQWNFSSPGAAGARRNPIFRRETPMVSG